MKLDAYTRCLSAGQARQEVMRLRRLAVTLAAKSDNAMCWMNPRELAERILRAPTRSGRIAIPRKRFLRNCGHFYDRNSDSGYRCSSVPSTVACENCHNQVTIPSRGWTGVCRQCGQTVTRTGAPMRIGP